MKSLSAQIEQRLLDDFRSQAEACAQLGSPLTAGLVTHMAQDYQHNGPVKDLIGG